MKKILPLILVLLLIVSGILLYKKKALTPKSDTQMQTQKPTPQQAVVSRKNSEVTNVEPLYASIDEDVAYFEDTVGYYAQPGEEGDFPGVVMIHEWWGLNTHIKDMARELAQQGYRVLAVDLFGSVATTSDEARAQVSALDQEQALNNLQAATTYLRARGASKIASLGWCFGGGQSLQMSVNQDVDATVIYYGNLITDSEQLSNLNSPVLGIFGSEDTSIPVDSVNQFETTLEELNIAKDITIYDGVGHAFANPSGDNYAPDETKDAWAKTLEFLQSNLK